MAEECKYSERFGRPVEDVFRGKCRVSENPTMECDRDPTCDMFATKEETGEVCFYTASALKIRDDRNFYGEGKTSYKDCGSMIDSFLESIDEGGDADESQRAVTEAMIDLLNTGERRISVLDEESWSKAEDAATNLSQCEIEQGNYRCDLDVYLPQFKKRGTVKCDEIVELDGERQSVGLYSALRGLTEEQCLRKCDDEKGCSGVAFWETGLRSQMDTAQFYADMNDPSVLSRQDTCQLWVGDDRGENGVCLEDKRKDTEVRTVVIDTMGIIREYSTEFYHREHLEKALKVGGMEGVCKIEKNPDYDGQSTEVEFKLEGCAMMVVKFFDGTSRDGEILSERIMEDAVTSQSNRWRFVGNGECRTESMGHEILREYLSDSKFAVVSPGNQYAVGDVLTLQGGNNDARLSVTEVGPVGGILAVEMVDAGTGYDGGEVYNISGGSGRGGKVKMTEMSMSLCQRRCGLDELCSAMAYDEDGEKTSCRLYKGKYAYTNVSVEGKRFRPNDFSSERPGRCLDGPDNKFWAKDDIGRAIIQMNAKAEEKCKQRCQDMPGCNAVNMKTEGDSLVCKTMGTCTVEGASESSTDWVYANLQPGKGVPVSYPRVQAIDKRTCYKGRSRQPCSSSRDWLRFYKQMVPDCNAGELKICSVEDKKRCSTIEDEGACRSSGACSWDGECKHDAEKCPIPGESPIATGAATDACRASLGQYMQGRFIGVDGQERGRICPPNGSAVAVANEETCRRLCSMEQGCAYYTYTPGKGGGIGSCSTHREEECASMISSNYARDQTVSNEKVYDLSVGEAIVASSQEQCWAKDVKSEAVASMLITPEFKGDDYIEDSSRCVLLGERQVCARINTVEKSDECPLPDFPCYAGFEDGCYPADSAGACPSIPVPRDRRVEVMASVEKGDVTCETARSRTECSLIDSAIIDDYSIVDPVEGIPIERLALSDENGAEFREVHMMDGGGLLFDLAPEERGKKVDLTRAMPKRFGHQVVDVVDNAKVVVNNSERSIRCTVPIDSNTYMMMLDDATGIESSRGVIEHRVVASGDRNAKNRGSGERCVSDRDCASTKTDSILCQLFQTEEECNANPPCGFSGGVCRPKHGKCDLTGEYSCFGRCLADEADPYKTRRENCPIDEATYESSCERTLERVVEAIRPDRNVAGYTRYRRKRPKKRPEGASCFRNADCGKGVCTKGFCGGPEKKRPVGETCSQSEQCEDGLLCGTGGPCEGRCQKKDGTCAGGLVPLRTTDFAGLLDLDMFGCVDRTASAADAAALCEKSILADGGVKGVTKCNAFMRYEDRHPGNLSGKTCFYHHIIDDVDEEAHMEPWEILRNAQRPGQGASGDLYIRNVTQPIPDGVKLRANVRPKTFGTLEPVAVGPGCDAERNLLNSILEDLTTDSSGGNNADDVDVNDVLTQSVTAPPTATSNDPCNDEGRCCPSKDYAREGNICYGREGSVAGTRCRIGEVDIPNSKPGRFDLLLSLIEGESGCTVDKAAQKITIMVNSSLHEAFSGIPSFSDAASVRDRGGMLRSSDNKFDVLEFRPGFFKMEKQTQNQLIEAVIAKVVPQCPTAADRIRLARQNRTGSPSVEKKGPSGLMIGAMIAVGVLLAVAKAKKKVPSGLLAAYAGLCAVAVMATSM